MPTPLSATELAEKLDWGLLSPEATWTVRRYGALLQAGFGTRAVAAYYGLPASEVSQSLVRLRAEIMAIVETGTAALAADA